LTPTSSNSARRSIALSTSTRFSRIIRRRMRFT
jgi:hypothetical protein